MKNIVIENAMTRYDLLIGEFNTSYETTMCCFTWLKSGMGGPSLTWPKGSNLYASYVLEKTDINLADLTGILSAIKHYFPESIGEMMYFNEDYMYNKDLHSTLCSRG